MRTRTTIENEVILITGGAGFLGSVLCNKLKDRNTIIVLDRNENKCRNLYDNTSVQVAVGTLEDDIFVNSIFLKYKPTIVFHCAAQKHVLTGEQNPLSTMNSNILGTLTLLRAAREVDTKKFIFVSTDKAELPTNVYGETKYIAEQLIKVFAEQTPHTYLACRFCNLWGSSGSVVEIFKNNIKANKAIRIAKDTYRYFINVEDAADLLIHLACEGISGKVYLSGSGKRISVEEVAKRVCEDLNVDFNAIIKEYIEPAPYEKRNEDYLKIDKYIEII